ncbi:sensor histidine kinase [Aliarcobacter trophiarum]|uniref:sensor histidine kinase n=1 Tax=Aliarcobacter trophiarum TaxID=708186 RepID=UPI00100B86AB|nr:PAS domain-containing sensor histidine kinase [Aliarcobacter trophiarum]RXI25302.1 PAS domain-containing sensor histidine kinase [Aliarcobacter trophiarum]
MKMTFNIKLFSAFILLIIIILLVINIAFHKYYTEYSNKVESDKLEYILDAKSDSFLNFIRKYDEKLGLVERFLSNNSDKKDVTNNIKKYIFEDKNILNFKIVSFSSKESLKLYNQNANRNIPVKGLRTLYMEPYFKELQNLDRFEIFHFCEDGNRDFLNFAIRGEKEFYIIKVDLKTLFDNISSSHSNRILIQDTHGVFFDLSKTEINSRDYISKKVYIKDNKFYTFYIKKASNTQDVLRNDYYSFIILFIFILAIVLAYIFTTIINRDNKKVEDENKKLNFDIEENSLALNENQKIMNEHIMFIQIDKHGVISDISHAFSSFLGYEQSELIGHKYTLFIFKDMKQVLKKALKNSLNSKTFELRNIQGKRKNLESFWVDIFVEEISLADESFVYNVICQDVTDKKRIYNLYQDLNTKIDEYDAIFENVDSGIALLNLGGQFVKINNKMMTLLGYSEKELLGLSAIDVIVPSSKDILSKMLNSIGDLTKILKVEKIFIKKDKTPIHLELSLILLSKKERIIFILNSLEDKRELQELNFNLEKTIKKEIKKSKAKDIIHYQEQIKSAKLSYIGALSAGITHEINTPLTYVKGNLELMLYDIEDLEPSAIKDRMLQDSQKMKEGLNRIANIVESMREISHSKEGVKSNFNIYATILTALTMAHNRAKHISKIYLNGEVFDINSVNSDKYIFMSNVQKQRIEQIWIIIINNALDELIKIEDYDKRELKIDILEDKNSILVRFKDNAGGLSKDILKKLFEPFTSSKTQGGMGIGLSIAKKIVEEHNGSIKAYNEDNGALFEIRLKKEDNV